MNVDILLKESRTKKRDEILAMEKINDALQDKIRFEAVFRIRIEKEFMNILQVFFGSKLPETDDEQKKNICCLFLLM